MFEGAFELIHPRGEAHRLIHLVDAADSTGWSAGIPYDLVILSADAWGTSQLKATLLEASGRLAQDGLLWLTARASDRRRMAETISEAGLRVAARLVQLPNPSAVSTLVPLELMGNNDVTNLTARQPHLRRLAAAGLRVPGTGRLIELAYHGVGFVLTKLEAPAPYDWLYRLAGAEPQGRAVVLRRSWNHPGAVTCYVFWGAPSRLQAVAKVSAKGEPAARVDREAENLETVARGAASCSVEVPRIIAVRQDGRAVLLMAAMQGELAAGLLRRNPQQSRILLRRIMDWLIRWNQATVSKTLDDNPAVREFESNMLLAERAGGIHQNFLAALRSTDVELRASIPSVAAHRDLTMWNVLVQDVPLCDFFYALLDAAAAAEGYRDQVAAFEKVFIAPPQPEGIELGLKAGSALGLTREQVSHCFHLCWLHHAANELRRDPVREGPFLRILRRVSGQHVRFQ
jgi:hypothetical protein